MFRETSQFEPSIYIPICAFDIFGSLRIRAWHNTGENDATKKESFGEEAAKHHSSVRWLHMPPLVLSSLQWSDKWSKKLRCRPSWTLIITCNGLARCWGGIRPAGQVAVGRRMASSSNNESRANWTPICCHAKHSEPLKTASSHSERVWWECFLPQGSRAVKKGGWKTRAMSYWLRSGGKVKYELQCTVY